ncbi:MAG: hypothetical protein HY289_05675 [Planctomycetes bacterium]|nr:hypothetical protein [Planctomycetota bacterium]
MKQLLAMAFLASAAMFGFTADSQAHCGKFRGCRGGCDAPCATAAAAPAPAPVFEERKVKVAKTVMKEKEIDVIECRRVMKEEKYTYTVCVQVTKDEKRKVIVCTPTTREEDYTYTVMVPKTEKRTIKCTTYKCERVMITEKVPVCKTICVTCVDECGRCHTRRERVTVMEERTRCVVQRTPIVEEKVVDVTVCVPEQRKGKRTICETIRAEKEVMVKVCSFEHQKKEGTRTVCTTEQVKVKRKVSYCETVWEEQVVRVQVGGGCAPSCNDCGRRVGFFRRGGGCCN